MSPSLVSVVFLSYNNARFIRRAIESVLSQTYGHFEVIAIDDGSSDESVSILESYGDDRIKVFRHPQNLGVTLSYNEAIERATGDFLLNLDSDDATSPTRMALQLEAFAADPEVDVVGTYVEIIDENDQPHPRAVELESLLNQPWDFNLPRTWIGQNNLVRSSTMMHRRMHERIGLVDLGARRAGDYDLWTHALRTGGRFAMIPERLTQYRVHSGGLTHGDPKATFLELAYSLIRRLLPMMQETDDLDDLRRARDWMAADPQFLALPPPAQARLFGLFLCGWDDSLLHFGAGVEGREPVPAEIAMAGRRFLQIERAVKAEADSLVETAAWHARQTESWKTAFENGEAASAAFVEARDWHAQQVENWKAAYEAERALREKLLAERT